MKKRLKKMLTIAVLIIAIGVGGVLIFLRQIQFGQLPAGPRLEQVEKSPHYSEGKFQNLQVTPTLANNKGFVSSLWEYFFVKKERLAPEEAPPSLKTDLKALDKNRDLMIWLGHSSYFIQLGGRTILVDPVFSPYASPVSFANKAFPGTNLYRAEELPDIDFLLISHDHWDHLDYPTVTALKPKIKKIVTGLGVGAHFERWGFSPDMVQEADWNTRLHFEGLDIQVLPARHFSGRSLTRNKTLWAAFALIAGERRIFLSGDSGYGAHFKQIGEEFGGFDLVSLDTGQYDPGWPYVHMNPEEAARAAEDLGAKALLPGHVGKFSIANHSWDDPFIRITAAAQGRDYSLLTPLIGEPVYLDEAYRSYPRWWETIK